MKRLINVFHSCHMPVNQAKKAYLSRHTVTYILRSKKAGTEATLYE
ncbi:hypothetical protein [Enterococcus durans]|nr:hypothetical protein [Enterococcus durans]MZG90045.1 hypothetical protein [Enterococcus durans]MZH90802.1 hypothetical protein [Enterococcus durans]